MTLAPGKAPDDRGAPHERAVRPRPFWVVALKALLIFVFLMLYTLFNIWFERRVVAKMQHRIGPNVNGPFGLLQSLADGVKLGAQGGHRRQGGRQGRLHPGADPRHDPGLRRLGGHPLRSRRQIPFTDRMTPLQLTDLPVAVLYILAMTSIGVYGIVLAGWSSGSIYACSAVCGRAPR